MSSDLPYHRFTAQRTTKNLVHKRDAADTRVSLLSCVGGRNRNAFSSITPLPASFRHPSPYSGTLLLREPYNRQQTGVCRDGSSNPSTHRSTVARISAFSDGEQEIGVNFGRKPIFVVCWSDSYQALVGQSFTSQEHPPQGVIFAQVGAGSPRLQLAFFLSKRSIEARSIKILRSAKIPRSTKILGSH